MTSAERGVACVGCGAIVPDVDGPTHRYIGALPGCWAIFGEVLAREYTHARYGRAHRLTVDSYTAQHPGTPSPQSIQSVAVHLMSLHLVLDRGYDHARATRAMQEATTRKGAYRWLEPPPSLGPVTVLDVVGVDDPPEYARQVERWARSVWSAWAPHHGTIRGGPFSSRRG